MPPPHWHPPVELSKAEQTIISRIMHSQTVHLFTPEPPGTVSGLTHSASSATMEWGFQLLKQRSQQRDFVSVRKS
jgi:hypothetical protein